MVTSGKEAGLIVEDVVHLTDIIQPQIHALGTELSWGIDQISGMVRMMAFTGQPARVRSQPSSNIPQF